MAKAHLDINAIRNILPHRYPFLLVDRILDVNLEEDTIVGLKALTMNELFFQGHFPEVPVMPGVLILEALAQTGGILIHEKGFGEKTALLLSVNNAKFRRPAMPGDTLHLHVKGNHLGVRGGKVHGKALIDGELAAEAEIGFALKRFDQI